MKTFTTYAEKKAKQILNLLQGYTRGIRITAMFMLLVVGTSNAWGAVGFESYDCGIKYYAGASDVEWNFSGQTAQTKDLGEISTLYLKEWFARMYQNEDNTIYGQDYHKMYYKIHRTAVAAGTSNFTTLTANWWQWNNWQSSGYRYPNGGNNSLNTNLLSGLGSGKYTMTFYFQHNGKSTYKSTTNTLKWTYNIVPNVSGFNVTVSNTVSGTGTSEDPYIIESEKNTTLTVSGSKASTDANSSLYAKFGSDNYSTTLSKNLTPTATKQSITIYAKYYNSNDNLSGEESSKTIYYKMEVPKYTITFGVEGTGGTVAAKVGSTTINTGSSHDENTSIVFTANPSTGYHFSKWIDANGNQLSTSIPYTHTLTANATVKAVFNLNTYYVKFNANGGSGTMSNQLFTYGSSQNLTANAFTRDGYKFAGWATSTSGSVVYADEEYVKNLTSTNNGTYNLYAKWTEIKSTVTVTTANEAYGTLKFGSTATDWGTTTSVGVSTSQQITATANEGYKFVKWELSGSATSTSTLTNATITLKSDGTGTVGTATAVFEEDLNSRWHLVGDDGNVFPAGWNVNDNSMMKKRSGSSSEKKVYMTITVSDIKTYEFKVVDDNGSDSDKWYGYSTGSTFLEWTETSTKTVYTKSNMSENSNNLKFTPNAVGDYEFKVDYSGDNPKVTITYPEVGSVSSYRLVGDWGNGWDATGIAFNAEGKVSLELEKRERPDYTFKVKASNGKHYTAADEHKRQFTRQHNIETISDDTDYPVDNPHNLQLQADAKGTYIFEFDPATKQLKVTHPEREDGAYLVGDFSDGEAGITDPDDSGKDWTEEYGETFDSNDDCTHGVVEVCDWGEENVTLNFKIKINGIWYGFYHEEDADPLNITTSGTYTLEDQYAYLSASNVQLTTNGEEGCYYFEYTLNGDGTLSVLIIFPNDTRTVTFNMQGHGTQVDPQHVLYNQTAVKPYVSDVDGYLFAGWYTDADCTKEYDFNTPVTQDITLYAKWIPYGDCIFYKNNLNWDEVYVYFYSSDKYWTDDKGTGAKYNKTFTRDEDTNHSPHYRKFRGKMTRIGLTDIWYFDYISAAKVIDSNHWAEIKERDPYTNDYSNIAFTAHKQDEYEYFDNTKVIRRGDFKPQMQLFIPQTDQTPTYLNKHDGVSAKYYNKGLWLKYNSTESGYNWSSNVGNWDNNTNYFTSEIAGGYSFTAEVELNAGSTYQFKIHNQNGTWYGNPGTMTQDNCTNWWFKEEVNDNAKIQPTVKGTYIFTTYLGDGKVMISLDYPLSTGDYRLAYKDNTADSFHPGHYLKKRSTSHLDTVSFFIHHDKQPQVIAQRCTAIDAQGNATWETITSILVNPATPITESGVYNFTLEQLADQTDPHLLNETRPYTGDYYIRTDAAAGGWKSFRQEGNKMTYSSYADEHEDFNHYFCEWVSQEKGLKNVSYTVANDYSYCISDTLDDDVDTNHPIIVSNNDLDKKGNLPVNNDGTLKDANVRFGWDSKTNTLRRAYIAGSGHKKDRFLVLEGNAFLHDINDKRFTGNTAAGQDRFNLTDDEVVFEDMGNWIYQIDVKANKDTKIDLTALYDGEVQYFKGGSKDEDEIPLIVTTNDNEKYYKIRIIYDFKTNHLISAWLPEDETITTDEQLGADMMIIRHNQDPAEQLNFDPTNRKLSGVGTAYAVITFDKYFLNNKDKTGNELAEKKSENERKFYWISFPFDVKLSEVFGFGEYGDQWIMEYYDGEARAKEGYWAETETFWKYITNKNYVLKAGQGYVLCLNLNKMGFTSTVFANTTEVSLYFPSASPLNIITGEFTEVTVPAHECTIERDNRNIYDSNWNLIGVPGFADITDVSIGESHHKEHNTEIKADCVSFYYKYVPADNKYDATTNKETFQTMFAYMVQFAGTINWQAKTIPAPLAARRTGSMPSQYDLRLEVAHGEQTDQTFVQLKEADATAEFDMNVDMTKIFNSGMNIYTLTGSNAIQVAGNALPMAKATIPVGVVTATAGEYTFRMPDGTDGISVFLIDNQTGAQTNMLLDEYTITLDAGTCENRFYLAVDPDRTATAVENIGEEAKGEEAKDQIKKFLIDGQLFIRTADGTFDAKGQRL